ncbi:MAG: serine/threonine-protein kinase, partial [Phycisphaerales bacterium]
MEAVDFARVRELFHAAFELDEQERGPFLDTACAGDAGLRAEVEALVRANLSAGDRFDPASAAIGDRLLQSTAVAAADPEQIGPYTVIRRLGQGGMGVVYLAKQGHPEREVALKVLRSGPGSDALRSRFQQEIRVLGRLEHPGIARIYEAGAFHSASGPAPYFAMEYVDGATLTEYVRERRPGVRARLQLFAAICDAVQYAHQKAIIHRDLKPGNILVVDAPETGETRGTAAGGPDPTTGGGARPKILDFGVARLLEAEAGDLSIYTQPGLVVGTIAYMSPEQLSGVGEIVDTRGDVYALGVILYELLAGHLPHDVRERSIADAARMICEQEPLPLPATMTDPAERIDEDLRTIVGKALEKDRDRRYATAADLSADVWRYLRNEPILAHPPSTAYQFRKFASRHRGALFASVAMLVLLVGGVIGTSIGLLRSRSAREAEHEQRERAETISAFIASAMRSSDPYAGGKQDVRVSEAMGKAVRELEEGAFRAQPRTEAELQLTIARILGDNAKPAEALPLAERSLRTLEALTPRDDAMIADAHQEIAICLHWLGKPKEAEEHARAALVIREKAETPDNRALAE